MGLTYDGITYRSLEEQVRYDAEQVQLLKQADVTINGNLQTVSENLQTEINGKLTKPTNPSAESAVTMLADGTVGTKPLSEIGGGGKLYRHFIGYTDNTFNSFELVIYLTQKNTPFSLAEFIAFTKEKKISYCLSTFSMGESGKVTGTYYLPGLLSASSNGEKLVLTGKKPGVAVQDGGGLSFNVTLNSTSNPHFTDTVTEL